MPSYSEKKLKSMIVRVNKKIVGEDFVASVPPQGKLKVKNLYIDPDTGKLTVEYDDGR